MKSDRSPLLNVRYLAVAAVLALSATALAGCGGSTESRQVATGRRARGSGAEQGFITHREGEAFPPAYLTRMDSLAARSLFQLRAVPNEFDTVKRGETFADHLRRRSESYLYTGVLRGAVYRLGSYPLFVRLMPNTAFFVAEDDWGRIGFRMLATRDGKLYLLPLQLGILMRDCGYHLRIEETVEWSQVFLAVELAYRSMGGGARTSWESAQTDPASSVRLAARYPGYGRDEILDGRAPLIPAFKVESVDTTPTKEFGGYDGDVVFVYRVGAATDTWAIPFWLFENPEDQDGPPLLRPDPTIWGLLDVIFSGAREQIQKDLEVVEAYLGKTDAICS
jgi:hypothetical protein